MSSPEPSVNAKQGKPHPDYMKFILFSLTHWKKAKVPLPKIISLNMKTVSYTNVI